MKVHNIILLKNISSEKATYVLQRVTSTINPLLLYINNEKHIYVMYIKRFLKKPVVLKIRNVPFREESFAVIL